MKKLIVVALLGLSGCSAIDSIFNPSPNVVATMEATLAAADNAALGYVNLTSCKAVPAQKVCRDPTITVNIGKAALSAHTAVKAAEANETASNVQAAQNLVTAYQAIVGALQ